MFARILKCSVAVGILLTSLTLSLSRVLGDEAQREPIVYVNPKVPTVELPTYPGRRYEAVVPDTLDLAERAALGCHGLTGPLDPDADYELYWQARFLFNPPIMWHNHNDHVQAKSLEALPLLRLTSGSRENEHVDKRWMETTCE